MKVLITQSETVRFLTRADREDVIMDGFHVFIGHGDWMVLSPPISTKLVL